MSMVLSTLADRFALEYEVAEGGMGTVYRAIDRHRDAPVAVKVLNYSAPGAQARFLREAAVLAELRHPNIVQYIAHGRGADGNPFLVMEWLEGQELGQFLRDRARANTDRGDSKRSATVMVPSIARLSSLSEHGAEECLHTGTDPTVDIPDTNAQTPPRLLSSPRDVLQLAIGLSTALAALHERGVVHRDVKPSNIFLVDGDIAKLKLLDLGTAWRYDDIGRLTRTGRLLGTPRYMAPEQVQANGSITPATDVWGMGVVLYQCLTGVPPFKGQGLAAVLASIILAEPRPILDLRPDTPLAFAELIMEMLDKQPERRPHDAQQVLDQLRALDRDQFQCDGAPARLDTPMLPPTLTEDESRFTCMLFVAGPAASLSEPALAQAVAGCRGHIRRLFNDTALITVQRTQSPVEQAAMAARLALTLNSAVRDSRLVLVTSRTEGERHVQAVADTAAAIAKNAHPATIRLDELTASMLETRFHIGRQGEALYLGEQRVYPAARRILGKPTQWMGRRRALATLHATFEECVDGDTARAVLVIGAGGMGKSRLCVEFLRALGQSDTDREVLFGCGDMARAGSPFTVLTPAIRRCLGLLPGEPDDVARGKIRDRVAARARADDVDFIASFLGEIVGVEFPEDTHPALSSSHSDPSFRVELMKRAWIDFLRAECRRKPLVFIVEDLHWGDVPSVDFLDSALFALRDCPFMLLALARPSVATAFPRLWHKRDVTELRLHPLSNKESERLVRNALGDACSDAQVATVVDRAEGNPFILEELIRMVARGSTALPDTVVAIAQERLMSLGHDEKRVLRAASVFGESFWRGGVQTLLGEHDSIDVAAKLRALEDIHVILRQSCTRFVGEPEYRFEHALTRDAAYALLTEDDRRIGHALAGEWLERVGERDAMVVAEHWTRGDQPERAVSHLCHAAEHALAANDCKAALACVERSVEFGVDGVQQGRMCLVSAWANIWIGDHATSREQGLQAAGLLTPGSAEWLTGLGHAVAGSYRLGEIERGRELTENVLEMVCAPGAEGHQIICLCRAGFQEFFDGRVVQGERILSRVSLLAAAARRLDRRTQGQINSVLSLRSCLLHRLIEALRYSDRAQVAFLDTGDLHNALIERVSKSHILVTLGCYHEAVELARDILAESLEYDNWHVAVQAKSSLGSALLQERGPTPEVVTLLTDAMNELRLMGNRRMEGISLIRMAELAFALDEFERAEAYAVAAIERLGESRPMLIWALSTRALCLLRLGDTHEALNEAQRALRIHDEIGGSLHRESAVYYALVQALIANGQLTAAREVGLRGVALVREAGQRIDDPDVKRAFLDVFHNRMLLQSTRGLTADE